MTSDKENIRIKIKGMTCATCAKTVEKSLANLNNVLKANVNLATETASVELILGNVDLKTVKKAIQEAGYEETRKKELKSRLIRIIIGFVFGILLMLMGYLKLTLPFEKSLLMLLVATPPFIMVEIWKANRKVFLGVELIIGRINTLNILRRN